MHINLREATLRQIERQTNLPDRHDGSDRYDL